MNVDLIDIVYRDIKEYVSAKSKYSVRVTQKSLKQNDKFPLITVTSRNNANILATTDFRDITDKVTVVIDVYAEDMAVGNETVSNVNIVKELISLVDDVMRRKYRMLRTSCEPTPNLDNTIYRMTSIYTKKMITNKNLLI